MRFWTQSLVVLAFVAVAPTAQAQQHIAGEYFVYGRNPDGSAYSGTVRISVTGPGSVAVNWAVGSTYAGVGTLNGDVLTVNWGGNHPAIYVVMPDGELHGTWGDGVAFELLTRTPR